MRFWVEVGTTISGGFELNVESLEEAKKVVDHMKRSELEAKRGDVTHDTHVAVYNYLGEDTNPFENDEVYEFEL